MLRAAHLVGVLLSVQASAAQWSLDFSHTAQCLDADAFSAAVEARLGRAVFSDQEASRGTLLGSIDGEPEHWHASVTLRDAQGATIAVREHRSSSVDCHSLDEPLVLITAMLIQSQPTTLAAAPTSQPPLLDLPRTPVVSQSPGRGAVGPKILTGRLGLVPMVGVGQLPRVAAGGRLLGRRWGRRSRLLLQSRC